MNAHALQKYICLISLNAENKPLVNRIMAALKAQADPSAQAKWIDSKGAGICIKTPLRAAAIWSICSAQCQTSQDHQCMHDMVVLELAQDHKAWPESKLAPWLR